MGKDLLPKWKIHQFNSATTKDYSFVRMEWVNCSFCGKKLLLASLSPGSVLQVKCRHCYIITSLSAQ